MGFLDNLIKNLDDLEKAVVMLDDKLNSGAKMVEKGAQNADTTLQKIDQAGQKAMDIVRSKEQKQPETD